MTTPRSRVTSGVKKTRISGNPSQGQTRSGAQRITAPNRKVSRGDAGNVQSQRGYAPRTGNGPSRKALGLPPKRRGTSAD